MLRDELVKFLNDYLKINDIEDNSWNGLQFEGKENVQKIASAVDAGIETFEMAISLNADFLIVHHGLFWKGGDPSINKNSKKRIDILYKNNMSLYAAHLPLDRHKEIGNNALILKMLNAKIKNEFVFSKDKNIGWIGETNKTMNIREIEKVINSELNAKCICLPFGPEKIKSIAVCSGGGNYDDFFEALEKKVDLYITGDTSEIYHTAKDYGISVIFAGHHATETLGVKALLEILRKKFKVKTEFMDIETGL